MASPVVVQGTPVPFGSSPQPVQDQQNSGDNNDAEARTGCKDPVFAVLFYVNLIALIAVAAAYGPAALEGTSTSTASYDGYIIAVAITSVISFFVSGLGLLVMMKFPETIIKAALIFVIAMSLVWCILAFASGSVLGGVVGLVFFAIGICYARAAWPRIPFASVNLTTAITAIKANFGVATFAYLFAILAVAWSIVWVIAFAGVFDRTYQCDENNVCSEPNYLSLFLLFVSFYFTHQVLEVRLQIFLLVCRCF